MGQVKNALIEVEDLVCGCLQQHRTLNQTIRDLKELYDNKKIDNPYLLNGDLIEDKYYQFKG
jgi:archaellum component FlaC